MKIILAVVLALLFIGCFLLYKAYRLLPTAELRRRSRETSDKSAGAVYGMAVYGSAFELLVWLAVGLSGAGLMVIAAGEGWWLALIVALAMAWLVLFVNPLHGASGRAWRTAARLAPAASLLLAQVEKLLAKAGFHFTKTTHYRPAHTGVYDRDDLLELLKRQAVQPDSRVNTADLKAAEGALTFSDKLAGKVMVPIKRVKTVGVNQSVGPLLMDELHKTGFKRFPVVRDTGAAKPQIIGTLFIDDVLEQTGKAKVRELMSGGIDYINEDQNLRECLYTFIRSQHFLLAVTNKLDDIVGIITLEDVLAQLLPAAEEPEQAT